MAVNSEFYKDMSKVEKKVWGITYRQLKAGLSLILSVVLISLSVFFIQDLALLIILVLICWLIFGLYPVLVMIGKADEIKRKLRTLFLYQNAYYYSGQIRRYAKNEFVQQKNISETDDF